MTASRKTLVIVESPSKAKTIGGYLGSRYKVIASVGHVRDLPKSKLGIDIENDFEPRYITIRGKGDLIKELKKEAKKASKVYLATDPDREGEAISWHLAYLLGIDPETPCRIEFNEITKSKIKEAIKQPRALNKELFDAQQARRALDRLVGYQISPLLWRKVGKGLSAGRVQSAALKIICDREKAIQAFVPEEYWTISAEFKGKKEFVAKLATIDGKKAKIENKENSDKILKELDSMHFIVSNLSGKERIRKPDPPFTTSSMQQDAGNKLNFSTKRTMMVAQQLYEGVEIKGKGTTGLITYLRTDSVRISDEAKMTALEYIKESYGDEYTGNTSFANKRKDIQDAHEAIRPTDVTLTPDKIKESLSRDQFKLYDLIWRRFLASRMKPAKYYNVNVDIEAGKYGFKASGSSLIFDGYQKVYKKASEKNKIKSLPEFEKGQKLSKPKISGEQNFTQPPARFTEASLIKELEEKDIGRPSTYAPIVTTLTGRKYIKREKKSLVPTDLGFLVTSLLEQYFGEIVDVDFTAEMEDKLDDVEASGTEWKQVIRDFYGPFSKELEAADKAIERVVLDDKPAGFDCDVCGRPMIIKHGRYGEFYACSGYPKCKNTKPIVNKIGVKCPICGKDIVEKKSKRGRIFYGCSGFPNCTQSYWQRPVNIKCPKCGNLLVESKSGKGMLECSNKECDFKQKKTDDEIVT